MTRRRALCGACEQIVRRDQAKTLQRLAIASAKR